MPEDLVVATALRCVAPNVRQHLELTQDDKIHYYSLKERLILMDKKAWSGDSYLKMVQQSMRARSGGPTPMDVDQIGQITKGKDKGGGKKGGKSKKGGWLPFGYGGGKYGGGKSYKGRGKQGGKCKKGKGKYGGRRGKGKGGGANNNTCRICGQQGHWGNECLAKLKR